MNKADSRLLEEFLGSAARPEGTLTFHELQGFLFAIACSPETIAPSEWLQKIGNDEDLKFGDQTEATRRCARMRNCRQVVSTAHATRR